MSQLKQMLREQQGSRSELGIVPRETFLSRRSPPRGRNVGGELDLAGSPAGIDLLSGSADGYERRPLPDLGISMLESEGISGSYSLEHSDSRAFGKSSHAQDRERRPRRAPGSAGPSPMLGDDQLGGFIAEKSPGSKPAPPLKFEYTFEWSDRPYYSKQTLTNSGEEIAPHIASPNTSISEKFSWRRKKAASSAAMGQLPSSASQHVFQPGLRSIASSMPSAGAGAQGDDDSLAATIRPRQPGKPSEGTCGEEHQSGLHEEASVVAVTTNEERKVVRQFFNDSFPRLTMYSSHEGRDVLFDSAVSTFFLQTDEPSEERGPTEGLKSLEEWIQAAEVPPPATKRGNSHPVIVVRGAPADAGLLCRHVCRAQCSSTTTRVAVFIDWPSLVRKVKDEEIKDRKGLLSFSFSEESCIPRVMQRAALVDAEKTPKTPSELFSIPPTPPSAQFIENLALKPIIWVLDRYDEEHLFSEERPPEVLFQLVTDDIPNPLRGLDDLVILGMDVKYRRTPPRCHPHQLALMLQRWGDHLEFCPRHIKILEQSDYRNFTNRVQKISAYHSEGRQLLFCDVSDDKQMGTLISTNLESAVLIADRVEIFEVGGPMANDWVNALAQFATKLTHVEVYDSAAMHSLTDEVVEKLAKSNPRLVHLNVGANNYHISNAGMRCIGDYCQRLESLCVSSSNKVTDKGIIYVGEKCRRLKAVDISNSRDGNISNNCLFALAKCCPSLTSLNVSEAIRPNDLITYEGVMEVIDKCRRLQRLDVNGTGGSITDLSIFALAEKCPTLTYLDIRRTRKITDESLLRIAEHCPKLSHLNIAYIDEPISDYSMKLIAKKCPLLTFLDISGSRNITDATLKVFAENSDGLLDHLCVGDTAGKITDDGIKVVARCSPRLRHLDINSTEDKITDTGVMIVAKECPLLQYLDVSWTNGKVTDVSMAEVARRCRHLRHLSVRYTGGKVSDDSMQLIVKNCPLLQHLDVSCTDGEVTDVTVFAAAAHSHQLQLLDVRLASGKVTNESLQAFGERPYLKVFKPTDPLDE